MTTHDIVILIAAIVGSGGVVAAIVALVKLRPEAGQILVTTAQSVVIVQTSVIENLEKQLNRVSNELEELRIECREREDMLLIRIRELEQKDAV
jgi:hypothetical protein